MCRNETGTKSPACTDELIHIALQALKENEVENVATGMKSEKIV